MHPPSQPPEPTTIPEGEPIFTEEDAVMLPLTLSSMSGEEGGSAWAELPMRIPLSDHGDPTRKVPTLSA